MSSEEMSGFVQQLEHEHDTSEPSDDVNGNDMHDDVIYEKSLYCTQVRENLLLE